MAAALELGHHVGVVVRLDPQAALARAPAWAVERAREVLAVCCDGVDELDEGLHLAVGARRAEGEAARLVRQERRRERVHGPPARCHSVRGPGIGGAAGQAVVQQEPAFGHEHAAAEEVEHAHEHRHHLAVCPRGRNGRGVEPTARPAAALRGTCGIDVKRVVQQPLGRAVGGQLVLALERGLDPLHENVRAIGRPRYPAALERPQRHQRE